MTSKTRSEMLREVMEADFAVYDLQLYLDTHPRDEKALAMFRDLVRQAAERKRAFEENFGPLTPDSATDTKEWTWIKSPWPWE